MKSKFKSFLMKSICWIIIFEIIAPNISVIKAYADIDVDSLSSAERATVEAKQEEK